MEQLCSGKNKTNILVRRALLDNGLTQEQAAKKLGICRAYLCRKLRKEMSADEQLELIEKMGISVGDYSEQFEECISIRKERTYPNNELVDELKNVYELASYVASEYRDIARMCKRTLSKLTEVSE